MTGKVLSVKATKGKRTATSRTSVANKRAVRIQGVKTRVIPATSAIWKLVKRREKSE